MSHFDEQPDSDPHGECLREISLLKDLAERLKQEAQIHAQEARTANNTIAEIYRLCTGATGEPGNWNGAEPVRQTLASNAAEYEAKDALIQSQADEMGRLREAAEEFDTQLSNWAKAYPLSVFPEPDLTMAHKLLMTAGMTLDSVSASNMRHVTSKLSELFEPVRTLTPQPPQE